MDSLLSSLYKRPISIFMFFLGLLILGVISLKEMDVSLLPPLDFPQITVHVTYPNSSPEEVEQNITRYLEEAFSPVNGVTNIISRSSSGEAIVILKFAWGTDMKYAALNIRQQADRVYSYFPKQAGRPVVNLKQPQNRPIVTIALSGASLWGLKRFAEYMLKRRLEQIPGVAEAAISGAPVREIKVYIDPNKLRNYGYSYRDIEKALQDNNILVSGGSIKKGHFRLALKINSEIKSVRDIADIPVLNGKTGGFVPLKKLAVIADSFKEPQSLSRFNGKPCIAVDIYKESQKNALKINVQIEKVLNEIRQVFPELQIQTVYSQASFIKTTVNNVSYAILGGAILAIAVLFFFLSNWRAPLIISISIPVSVIIAFLCMKFFNIGLNIISLAGLALGGGMLVDNSIVVLENIHRYREGGLSTFDAAVQGASEVAMPITTSTLTTIAVFIPVLFLKDISAAVFAQEAETVTFALLASLLVSLTLLPVVFILIDKKREFVSPNMFIGHRLESFYEFGINQTLKHENLFLLIVFIFLLISLFSLKYLDRRLFPETDQHAVEMRCNYIPGVSLEYIDGHIKRTEKILNRHKFVHYYYAELGKKQGVFLSPDQRKLNRSYMYIKLGDKINSNRFIKHFKEENLSGDKIQIEYRKVEPVLSGLLGQNEAPLSLFISGPSLNILDSLSKKLINQIETIHPGAIYNTNFFERYPAISLRLKKDQLAFYGLTASDVAKKLQIALKGVVATRLRDFDRKIDVLLKANESFRENIDKLLNLKIQNYPLRNFVEIKRTDELSYIERKNQNRIFRIDLRVPNVSDFVKKLNAQISKIDHPADYNIFWGGEWQESGKSVKQLYLAFLMAIILVYLILAAQFESFLAPFVIMFTVPLALIGIVPALLITGTTINIMSAIGLVVIVGIVVNDGILKIDFIQRLRHKGLNINDAIHTAGKMRIRPIVMTTVTTLFGLLPLALGIGPGADFQQPMAIVIIGGEGVATILTLFVLPLLYKKLVKK